MAPSILARLRRRTSSEKISSSVGSSTKIHPPKDVEIAKPMFTKQSLYASWPPQHLLSPFPYLNLLNAAQDYQFAHCSLIKRPVQASMHYQTRELPFAYPIGISLFPTPFPRRLFLEATQELQGLWDELYAAISCDAEWLRKVTEDLVKVDAFARCLWACFDRANHSRVERLRLQQNGESRVKQPVEDAEVGLAIWRCDYMLQQEGDRLALKQVEFNTLSCAGGIHANRVSDMHRYLANSGAYNAGNTHASRENLYSHPQAVEPPAITTASLPTNNTLASITLALARAHSYYISKHSSSTPPKDVKYCVLMLVQPRNINIADERPIEYALWGTSPVVPCFRLEYGTPILNCTQIAADGALLFTPASGGHSWEVSVVYVRAGYDEHEYFDEIKNLSVESVGAQARIRMEASRTIMCPPLLSHIATFKRVQQALTKAGAVEKFLSEEKAKKIRGTFVEMYELSDERAQRVVEDKDEVENWILKPSLEGGGHNIFGSDIAGHLRKLKQDEKDKYVLMKKIEPPPINNRLMSSRGMYDGVVINELGIFGACFWQRKRHMKQPDIDISEFAGWSLKTKAESIDEMSVVKGYGCFDSPLLVEDELYSKLSRPL